MTTPSDLPATDVARAWIAQDPAVIEAENARSGAGHAAGMLAASPNEWILKGTSQRRRYEVGPDSQEWAAQVERTIRLPGKRAIDRKLGEVGIALAEAEVGEAIHEAARAVLGLWIDRAASAQKRVLIAEHVELARNNRDAVEKRRKAGDAALLDVNVAAADLAAMEQQLSEAVANETKAIARLNIRYPGAGDLPPAPLADPVAVLESEAVWKERVLATSDPLMIATLAVERAEAAATRSRADRVPDPTVALFTASEVFGNERVTGISVSVPLPGGYRSQRLGQALDAVESARAARDRQQRVLEIEIADGYTDATSNYDRWQLAEEGAARTRDNARLTQRAYALGEVELQTLLLARRQSLDATQTALQARVAALRSYYQLLVDAHLIWGLAHE